MATILQKCFSSIFIIVLFHHIRSGAEGFGENKNVNQGLRLAEQCSHVLTKNAGVITLSTNLSFANSSQVCGIRVDNANSIHLMFRQERNKFDEGNYHARNLFQVAIYDQHPDLSKRPLDEWRNEEANKINVFHSEEIWLVVNYNGDHVTKLHDFHWSISYVAQIGDFAPECDINGLHMPDNGILMIQNATFGSVVNLQCYDGYVLEGNEYYSICSVKNGILSWIMTGTVCSSICNHPPVVRHATAHIRSSNFIDDRIVKNEFGASHVPWKREVSTNTTVLYACHEPFIVNGSESVECGYDITGVPQWFGSPPTCVLPDCSTTVHLHKPEGEIVSPGYPDYHLLDGAVVCSWEISAPVGSCIHLNVTDLDLPDEPGVEVVVFELGPVMPRLLLRLTNQSKDVSINSQASRIRITYSMPRNEVRGHRGFNIRYQIKPRDVSLRRKIRETGNDSKSHEGSFVDDVIMLPASNVTFNPETSSEASFTANTTIDTNQQSTIESILTPMKNDAEELTTKYFEPESTTEPTDNLTTQATNNTETSTVTVTHVSPDTSWHQPSSGSGDAYTDSTTQNSTTNSPRQTTDNSTLESTNITTEQPINIITEPSTDQTTGQSIDITTEPSTDQTTEPSTDQTTEQSINITTEPSTDQTTEPSTDQTTESSTNLVTEPFTGHSSEQSTGTPTKESSEHPTRKPSIASTEHSPKTSTGQSSIMATEQSTITTIEQSSTSAEQASASTEQSSTTSTEQSSISSTEYSTNQQENMSTQESTDQQSSTPVEPFSGLLSNTTSIPLLPSNGSAVNPRDNDADDNWKIAVGIIIPIIVLIAALVGVYVCYRKKYPVRMIIGREFAKFSNPNYNNRAHAPSLVREDADFYFSNRNSLNVRSDEFNPVNNKIMYDNMGFIRDDCSDEEEKERKFLQTKSWLFKKESGEQEAKVEVVTEVTAESSFISTPLFSAGQKSHLERGARKASTDTAFSEIPDGKKSNPVPKPRLKKKASDSSKDDEASSANLPSDEHQRTSGIRSSSDSDTKINTHPPLHGNIGLPDKQQIGNESRTKEGQNEYIKDPMRLFQQPSFDEVWAQVKARSKSLNTEWSPDKRSRSISFDPSKSARKMSLHDEIFPGSQVKSFATRRLSELHADINSKVTAFIVGADVRDRGSSMGSSVITSEEDPSELLSEQQTGFRRPVSSDNINSAQRELRPNRGSNNEGLIKGGVHDKEEGYDTDHDVWTATSLRNNGLAEAAAATNFNIAQLQPVNRDPYYSKNNPFNIDPDDVESQENKDSKKEKPVPKLQSDVEDLHLPMISTSSIVLQNIIDKNKMTPDLPNLTLIGRNSDNTRGGDAHSDQASQLVSPGSFHESMGVTTSNPTVFSGYTLEKSLVNPEGMNLGGADSKGEGMNTIQVLKHADFTRQIHCGEDDVLDYTDGLNKPYARDPNRHFDPVSREHKSPGASSKSLSGNSDPRSEASSEDINQAIFRPFSASLEMSHQGRRSDHEVTEGAISSIALDNLVDLRKDISKLQYSDSSSDSSDVLTSKDINFLSNPRQGHAMHDLSNPAVYDLIDKLSVSEESSNDEYTVHDIDSIEMGEEQPVLLTYRQSSYRLEEEDSPGDIDV